jgi:hypothetical protein
LSDELLFVIAIVLLYVFNLHRSQTTTATITGAPGLATAPGGTPVVSAPVALGTTGVGVISQTSAPVAVPFSGGTNVFVGPLTGGPSGISSVGMGLNSVVSGAAPPAPSGGPSGISSVSGGLQTIFSSMSRTRALGTQPNLRAASRRSVLMDQG